LSAEDIKTAVSDAPGSWLLPVRDIQAGNSTAWLHWQLDVSDIRQSARNSFLEMHNTSMYSPLCVLSGGIQWQMYLQSVWDDSKQGSTVGLYARATSLPAGTYCPCTYSLESLDSTGQAAAVHKEVNTFSVGDAACWGYADYFLLGAMPGGFDDAAWAAKGQPTFGSIVLRLTVETVGV
jgi:hypothetical protein